MDDREPEKADPDEGGVPGLAGKLEHLFAVVPKPDGGRYSNETAALALSDAGVKVSSVHLSHLRTGRRNNPSARLLAALAALFGVEIGYFFDAAVEDKANAELESLRALSDARLKGVMMRQGENFKQLDRIVSEILKEFEGPGGPRG